MTNFGLPFLPPRVALGRVPIGSGVLAGFRLARYVPRASSALPVPFFPVRAVPFGAALAMVNPSPTASPRRSGPTPLHRRRRRGYTLSHEGTRQGQGRDRGGGGRPQRRRHRGEAERRPLVRRRESRLVRPAVQAPPRGDDPAVRLSSRSPRSSRRATTSSVVNSSNPG